MSSSCPYCGAVLKLKFCVVCGRQSKLNKMGNIRNTARNTDATARLEDPFYEEEIDPRKSLRFHRNVRPVVEALLGGLIAGILIFCAARQALDLYIATNIHDTLMPWVNSHHFILPGNWPRKLKLQNNQVNSSNKKMARSKGSKSKN
jgi:hypothetical protein